jgi:ABC-2 type transport system permease protein
VLTRAGPVAYAVYPVRHAVFAHPGISPAANAAPSPTVTEGGRAVPVSLSIGIVAVLGAVLSGMVIAQLQRTE